MEENRWKKGSVGKRATLNRMIRESVTEKVALERGLKE